MTIDFMVSKDEPEKINKTPSLVVTLEGSLKNETSIKNPTILVQGNPIGANYAYIPEFKRYYFIEDITIVRDNLFTVKMRVDVLYTYRNEIQNLTCVIEKQYGSNTDMYIDDGTYRFENKISNEVVSFPNGFNDNPDYILLTAGGIV